MIKTKLAALTLAGLMAATSGLVFADAAAPTINKNADKLPGTDSAPMDRNSSNTPGAQTGTKKSGVTPQNGTSHGKTTHGDSHNKTQHDKTSTDTGSGKTSN